MTNHTPGPWKITTAYGIAVICDDGKALCEMWRRGNDTQAMVDARLIAAAPDLLAALQACDEAMEYMSEYDIPITLPEQVKAAIKKATGEE